MEPPAPVEDDTVATRSWRPAVIVGAALAAVVVLAVLVDGRLLVADPDPSVVTAADVRLARSLLHGATPPDALVEVCLDDEGRIEPACLGDAGLRVEAGEIAAEVVPRSCRQERSVVAECVERELEVDVPEQCVGPGGGVDVSCLTGAGTLLVLTDQCLDDGRLRQECLTTDVYGVPDREGAEDTFGGLPFSGGGLGADPQAAAPGQSTDPTDPTPAAPPDEEGRSVGETLALIIQAVAVTLLAGLAVYLVVVGLRSLLRSASGRTDDETERAGGDATAHDRTVMAASVVAGARRLDLSGDPSEAIIVAYATLLEGLAACAQGRHPAETPLEHLERVLAALDVRPQPLRVLTALFGEARFSDHPMTDAQRERARAALLAAATDLERVRETVG
ncbi:MAG TPA: DUF4129 domain-containing protein [Iamia sp.]|nr:DUF4129 domain-containing protein [Iamia sp.]